MVTKSSPNATILPCYFVAVCSAPAEGQDLFNGHAAETRYGLFLKASVQCYCALLALFPLRADWIDREGYA